MKIPKSFKIFGKKYKIIIDNDKCDNEKIWGLAEYRSNTIYLCDKYEGVNISEQEKEQIFLHEMTHVILKESGLQKEIHENNLENFTDLFSNCLQQILNTME